MLDSESQQKSAEESKEDEGWGSSDIDIDTDEEDEGTKERHIASFPSSVLDGDGGNGERGELTDSDGDSEDGFFDSVESSNYPKETEEDTFRTPSSPPLDEGRTEDSVLVDEKRRPEEGEGILHPLEGIYGLVSGRQIFVPVTQEQLPLTEDMIHEQQQVLAR